MSLHDEERTQTHRGGGHAKAEARSTEISQEPQELDEARKDPSLVLQREHGADTTLNLDFWTSTPCEDKYLLLKPLSV